MDKLKKALVLMLRSSSPGEVMAAREAILRVAKSEKLDAHQLVNGLLTALAKKNGQNGSGKRGEMSSMEMAECCQQWFERGGKLSEREQDFVEDMIGWRYPTEKQLSWLKAIYARVR